MDCGCRIVHFLVVKRLKVDVQGSREAWVRPLISWEHGAPNFAMRMFEVEPGGNTPLHSHNWEHEMFILEGDALIVCGEKEFKVGSGYAVFIPPGVEHTVVNIGPGTLRLLCLIPRLRHLKKPVKNPKKHMMDCFNGANVQV